MKSLDVKTLTLEQLAKTIDHSLLKPELTELIAYRLSPIAYRLSPIAYRLACDL